MQHTYLEKNENKLEKGFYNRSSTMLISPTRIRSFPLIKTVRIKHGLELLINALI